MFLINGITREITSDAPKEDFLFGVTSDEKANIKYFKGPRYTKNSVDLASASIRINYINGGAETDQYIVTDLEADEEYITFSWTFHRNVTKYKGAVQFIVCAVKCDADGSITNEWNTTSAKGTVQQGIEVDGSEYEEETADAIESILLAAQNRINAMVVDDTLSQAGVAADAAATGAAIESLTKELEEDISQLSEEIDKLSKNGLTTEQINALDGMFKVTAFSEDPSNAYNAFKTAFGIGSGSETEKTLSSISAIYTGGDVTVGTALTSLTGITVKATYSDGSTENVTGYTLSGTIAEGSNTITVSYGGKTTTFTVTGVAESSGGDDSGDTSELMDIITDVEWTDGIWLSTVTNNLGNETTNSNYSSSERIPFSAGETVTVKFAKANHKANIYCYDSNDACLSYFETGFGVVGTDETLTAVENTAYIRSTTNTANIGAGNIQMLITAREV